MSLNYLSPILWTKNLNETISFYENILGFRSQSNFPNFVSLTKDGVEIMFVVPQDEEDCEGPQNKVEFFPKLALTGSLFIVTTEVETLWMSIKDKVVIKSAIEDRDYHMRDFSILDNNGYELVFAQAIS